MKEDLITDLRHIEATAARLYEENELFRKFLKHELAWPDKQLDAVVREIASEVTIRVDCLECGNCCRTMLYTLSDADVERLSRRLGISVLEFEERYVAASDGGEKVCAETPCPFLEGNRCTLYTDRPEDCREFPHLENTGFRARTLGAMRNAEVCPIVFNTVERLKERTRFPRGSAAAAEPAPKHRPGRRH